MQSLENTATPSPRSTQHYLSLDDSIRVEYKQEIVDLTHRHHYALDNENTKLRDDAFSFAERDGVYTHYVSVSAISQHMHHFFKDLPKKLDIQYLGKKEDFSLLGVRPALTLEVTTDLHHAQRIAMYHSLITAVPFSHVAAVPPYIAQRGEALYSHRSTESLRTQPIPRQLAEELLYMTRAPSTESGIQYLMQFFNTCTHALLKQEGAYGMYERRNSLGWIPAEEPTDDTSVRVTSPLRNYMQTINLAQAHRIVGGETNFFKRKTMRRLCTYVNGVLADARRQREQQRMRILALRAA
jgi:hypothetical protein